MIPRAIPAIGRCIYCLRADIPLTKEHVIAEGLGGKRAESIFDMLFS